MPQTSTIQSKASAPSVWTLVLSVMFLNIFVFGLTGLALYSSYEQHLLNARTTAQNLSLVLQRSFDGELEKVQVVLNASAAEIERQIASGGVVPGELNPILTQLHKNISPAVALYVTNQHGDIKYGTGILPKINLSHRQYFQLLRKGRENGIVLSDPLSGASTGTRLIVFARRLNFPNGEFAGIVFAPIPTAFISAYFASLNLGPKGVASLRKGFGDFAIIERYPDNILGTSISAVGSPKHSPTFARMMAQGDTHQIYEDVTGVDKIYRTFSVRKLEKYNYYVGLGLAHEDVFANWRRETVQLLAIACVFLVTTIMLAKEQYLAWTRQKEALAMLTSMATLDALTGIPNRRRFDEVLEEEWLRALRDQKAISLVMVDIDNFKAYNDHYGHAQGDICLRMVAQVLNDSVRRPGDLVARYGGEEFVMLLPNTDALGARQVAERARQLIETLGLPHHFSETAKWVTVSAGAFTVKPNEQLQADVLLRNADELLYQAKNAGRNQVATKEWI